jgi:hypothetical protein
MPNNKLVKGDGRATNCSNNWAFWDNNAVIRNNIQPQHKNIAAMLLHNSGHLDNKAAFLYLLSSIVKGFSTE